MATRRKPKKMEVTSEVVGKPIEESFLPEETNKVSRAVVDAAAGQTLGDMVTKKPITRAEAEAALATGQTLTGDMAAAVQSLIAEEAAKVEEPKKKTPRKRPAEEKVTTIDLPSRAMVELYLEDPRFGAGADEYAEWAARRDVKGAIVKVDVSLTEASSFDSSEAAKALRNAGAFSVLPIVPRRPRAATVQQTGLSGEQLPVDEAFRRFLEGRTMPKGVSREEIEAAFAEVSMLPKPRAG